MEHEFRTSLKEKRTSLSKEIQTEKSQNIVETVKSCEAYLYASKIGTYYSVRGEADPANLITEVKKESSNTY